MLLYILLCCCLLSALSNTDLHSHSHTVMDHYRNGEQQCAYNKKKEFVTEGLECIPDKISPKQLEQMLENRESVK